MVLLTRQHPMERGRDLPIPTVNKSTAEPSQAVAAKRAFAYLRVSSEGQVNTGYSRDGLSIEGQREAADTKAAELGAEIVREWPALGKTAFVALHKRPDFLEMLEELKRLNNCGATRIDYVIVWATDRWARDVRAHFDAHDLVREAGARLVSITEPMIGDDTPESFYFEGMKAVSNQYESMRISRRVKLGMHQKAKEGGSCGGFRLGYLKGIEQLPDGRQVSSVVLDPDRHPYVTLAFQLFDSGEYSLSELAEELYRVGLRSFPTKRWPAAAKVSISALQRILRNPYYAGWIVYKRDTPDEQTFPGRHDALIDQDTFDRVQARLDEKRVAGERPQHHQHYLKGTVFCAGCGQRLSYGLSRSKNGERYAYYFCSSRINGTDCEMRTNIRPELIEQAVQRYYVERPVQLSAKQVQRRTEAIEALVAVSQEAVTQVKQAKTMLIARLKEQQIRLIRLHTEEGDDVSGDAFREERLRLQQDIRAAEASLAETEQRLQLDADILRMALELAEDVAEVYATADEPLKRGYNQAFFTKLLIAPEWDDSSGQTVVLVAGAELTKPYRELLAKGLVANITNEVELIRRATASTEDGSDGPPSVAGCSIFVKLAGLEGQPSNTLEGSSIDEEAEREGFEPSNEVNPRYAISSRARSTAPAPLPRRDAQRPRKATTLGGRPLVGSRGSVQPTGACQRRCFSRRAQPSARMWA
jgi:site-specific DNA recombinase